MNKKYNLKFSYLFYKDLDKILRYIKYKLLNPIAANNLVDEIEKEINDRLHMPKAFEKYNSKKDRRNAYYKIYIKKYVIFYTVDENYIYIKRILYNKRNFKNLL